MPKSATFTLLICILLLSGYRATAQKYTISGYVKDKSSGEVLIGANVYNKADLKGTATNTYGFYSLTLPKDSVSMVVSFVGYVPVELNFFLDKDIEINIELAALVELEEVVITAEEEIQQQTQMSSIKIPIQRIQELPAFMGEVDVLKVLQFLPGVQSGTEGSSGLYVRGGGPDQNLILLDGVPIYNSAHLFGFFSTFNPDAINNVDLIKGGFPARYGGRLSSVIDISMKEGSTKEFKGTATIGLIASKLTLEGPIKNEKTTFIVSGRRTYIDLLAAPIVKAMSDGTTTTGYYFYDLNTKINHKFSNTDRLYISGFFGQDKAYSRYKDTYTDFDTKYENNDELGLNWGNIIGAVRWNHLFSPRLFSNLTLTYSRYRFNIFERSESKTTGPGGTQTDTYAISYNSGIYDFAAKIDLDYIPNPDHYVRFGLNAIQHTFNPGVLSYKAGALDTVAGNFNTAALEMATYIEDDFRVGKALKINAGLHFSTFKVEESFYTSLQPRLSLRYLLANGLALKASYAAMAQYIHLLSNSGIGLPTDLWVPSTNRIKPQTSFQVAAGVAKTFNRMYEVSIEGYYKEMENLIEYKDGASFTSVNIDWQDKVEAGRGTAYGAEFFLQKKQGKFTGWLGYTLSWAYRQFENINFGRQYPYRYDRRHDVSITGVYKLSDHIHMSAAWVYGTGNAVSLPIESYARNNTNPNATFEFWGGEGVQYYEGRNGYRMAAYHRLDFSISWIKEKKHGIRRFTLGFYNMYNRKNPFFYQVGFDYETQQKKIIQYSLVPILPSISYRFDF